MTPEARVFLSLAMMGNEQRGNLHFRWTTLNPIPDLVIRARALRPAIASRLPPLTVRALAMLHRFPTGSILAA